MTRESVHDVELLRDSLQGRAESFEALVQRYQSLVCAITYGATGSVDKSEELAQETFLLAWKNLRQLRDLTRFKAWLCRIARNVIQNWLRSRQCDVSSKATGLEAASSQSSPMSPPVEVAIRQEQQAVVEQAIECIPEPYRVPLILFYRESKSTREVATALDISENNARQRIARARSMLRDQVAAMVETTLAKSKPGKAFTAAVVASLAGAVVKDAAAVTAAGATAASVSGVAVKIAAVAAGLLLVAGATFMIARREPPRPTPAPAHTPDRATRANELESTPESDPQTTAAMNATEVDYAGEDAAAPKDMAGPSSDPPAEAAPHEFQPQGVLSGLITDVETGAPVRDATVRLASNSLNLARTDEHGFYHIDKTFRPGNDTIFIDSNDYVGFGLNTDAPMLNLTQDGQVVKHFQLARACKVEVWVVDTNGAPIEAAEVIPTSLADSRGYEINDQGLPRRTDRNGYLLLGGIPPSPTEYMITAIAKETVRRTFTGDGVFVVETQLAHCPARAVVHLTDSNVIAQVTIVLQHGQTVHGYAEYNDGQPAAGAKLGVQPSWWHCMSSQDFYTVNSDGTFSIPHIVPGTYNILMASTNPVGSVISSQVIAQKELSLAEEEALLIRLPITSPATSVSISGRLLFEGGEKPSDVMITAASVELGKRSVLLPVMPSRRTDEPFSLDGLRPGNYRLSFSGEGIERIVLEAIPAPSVDLDVVLRATGVPRFAGSVFDERTGNPIERFEVRLRKMETRRGINTMPSDRWIAFNSKEGNFDLETVGPGVYQVQALADGYAPRWSEPVDTDENHNVFISLSPGGMMTGSIISPIGLPISGAKVVPLSLASGANPHTESLFASEKGAALTRDGAFTLSHLPEGPEAIKIVHPDYAFKIVRGIDIEASKTTQVGDIVLTPGGTVEGVVLDEQDNPLAGESLYFCDTATGTPGDPAHHLTTAVTDANGFYQVQHLPAQLCYVYRDQVQRGVARRAVTPKEGETNRLDFGGSFKVSGILDVPKGPLYGHRLVLRNPVPALFQCLTQTEESGYFVFSGIVPGTYQLAYEDPAGPTRWKTVRSVTVVDADLDMGLLNEVEASSQTIRPPSEVSSVPSVSPEPRMRCLSLKLPLLQPQFHWTFMSKADFLAGKLMVRIRRGQDISEIIVFENGMLSDGWEAMTLPANPKAGEIYFGFVSSQPCLTAPGDELEIELHVPKDLPGIGAIQTGVLPAGIYKAQGTYSLLTDAYKVPDALKGMPQETIEKLRQMSEFKAFLENWEPRWPLQITTEEGWLDPAQREGMKQTLERIKDQR
jgi:RNA polymerase sigma factor (sigma-70 family)